MSSQRAVRSIEAQASAGRVPPRIGLWGNFGTGNLGNECTLRAAIGVFRSRLPGVQLTCICPHPDRAASDHGLAAIPMSERRGAGHSSGGAIPASLRKVRRVAVEPFDWWRTIRAARRLDALVVVGTGVLSDAGEGPLGLPYELFRWSLAAKACKRTLQLLSVGVEGIESRLARGFIGDALRRADYRSYRDRRSRDSLEAIGLARPDDPVYPDLAFGLSLPAPPVRASATQDRRCVAVGVYDYRNRGTGGGEEEVEYQGYLERIGGFVAWLLGRGHRVRVVIGDLTYDVPVCRDLRAWLEARDVVLDEGRFCD